MYRQTKFLPVETFPETSQYMTFPETSQYMTFPETSQLLRKT